jgi:hypothetical protein
MEKKKIYSFVFDRNPTDKEWRAIEVFKVKAELLFQCSLITNNQGAIACNISAKAGEPTKFTVSLPNEDSLKSLLVSFRPFYLNNEPSNFNRVINIIKKYCRDTEIQVIADSYIDGWKHALFNNVIQVSDKDGLITASRIFDLWFNGHYFHSNEDKNEKLQSIKSVITEDFAKYLMVDSVYNCIEVIKQIYPGIQKLKRPSNQV